MSASRKVCPVNHLPHAGIPAGNDPFKERGLKIMVLHGYRPGKPLLDRKDGLLQIFKAHLFSALKGSMGFRNKGRNGNIDSETFFPGLQNPPQQRHNGLRFIVFVASGKPYHEIELYLPPSPRYNVFYDFDKVLHIEFLVCNAPHFIGSGLYRKGKGGFPDVRYVFKNFDSAPVNPEGRK